MAPSWWAGLTDPQHFQTFKCSYLGLLYQFAILIWTQDAAQSMVLNGWRIALVEPFWRR